MSEIYTKYKGTNILGLILSFVALNITVYGQFKDPQTGTFFFLGILVFVALYFIVSYPIFILKQKFNQIENNSSLILEIKKDLNKLNENINIITDTAKLNARVSLLEKRLLK